jgi:26S proteasome regulatory subunit T1
LYSQGVGPYNKKVTAVEKDIKDLNKRIFELVGVKESDTGLAPPSQWDLVSDKQMMQEEQPLQVSSSQSLALVGLSSPGITF